MRVVTAAVLLTAGSILAAALPPTNSARAQIAPSTAPGVGQADSAAARRVVTLAVARQALLARQPLVAKALLESLAADEPQSTEIRRLAASIATPPAPPPPPPPGGRRRTTLNELGDADRIVLRAMSKRLASLATVADAGERTDRARTLLAEVKSFAGRVPDLPRAWLMVGSLALQVDAAEDGRLASEHLVALRAHESSATETQQVLAALVQRGWMPRK